MKKVFIILGITIILLFVIIQNKNNILKKIYPIKYNEYVEKYANKYNVDKYLIYATIKAESNFKKDAESKKGAKGLMQLMLSTAKEISVETEVEVGENNILNPDININIGTYYLSKMIYKYGNFELALAAYNAGSGNVDKWILNGVLKSDGSNIENIPFKETNNYVRKILKDYKIYTDLYT